MLGSTALQNSFFSITFYQKCEEWFHSPSNQADLLQVLSRYKLTQRPWLFRILLVGKKERCLSRNHSYIRNQISLKSLVNVQLMDFAGRWSFVDSAKKTNRGQTLLLVWYSIGHIVYGIEPGSEHKHHLLFKLMQHMIFGSQKVLVCDSKGGLAMFMFLFKDLLLGNFKSMICFYLFFSDAINP